MESLVRAAQDGTIPARVAIVVANESDAPGLQKARDMGVPTEVVDHRDSSNREQHDRRLLDVLESRDVVLVCLAGYMRLLTPVFIAAYPGRIMNIHPSLLPSFQGFVAQRKSLEYGVKVSGCTVHFIDEEVDHGPIVAQACVEVQEDDTEEMLSKRILELEHRLYSRAVSLFFEGRLKIEGRRVVILPSPGG